MRERPDGDERGNSGEHENELARDAGSAAAAADASRVKALSRDAKQSAVTRQEQVDEACLVAVLAEFSFLLGE